ncbi:MAG: NADH-quinone oxidoreductase subunit L [Deltaproteobacteria bacterium]|nr:NADH-quinone oxidoreductase subunit L [Deltaproteobacteria bacterium]MBW2444566.1 NADH-quinone oxidoreductase subunit L [Deltaproteobacteria bacterium]
MVNGDIHTSDLLRLIPLFPLMGALIHGVMLGLARRSMPRRGVIAISCGAVILSFLTSILAVSELLGHPAESRALVDELFTWIGAGRFVAEASLLLDPLSAVMIVVVTGVGSLIHVYSIGYMDDDHRDDSGFQRFFCYLNLFTFSMLMLVLGDNLLVLFLGWEGVGLCSYLLIGFWYSDEWNAYCGSKAFIVNRIGDFGFLIGIFLLFAALAEVGHPTVAFGEIEASIGLISDRMVTMPWGGEWKLLTLIGLFFFVGAAGKSAQLPLYVWLPDAMAGPTPVSALIHAATMVTAGVYMVCRMNFLYAEAPGASAVIAWTGGLTALVAATIAVAQTDIKKVLAYSTVSQLGYMFLAAGCGGYSAAIFHLGTHAFFKALLFLGSGAVILAMHHEQDTDKMGGLARYIPKTHFVFGIGVLAIAGLPGFSGFFSKDEVLLSAFAADHIPGHTLLYGIGILTAVLTAFYMFRVHIRTFYGECRAPADVRSHIKEPADTVLVPLYVLAVLSAVAGLLSPPQLWGDLMGIANSNSLHHFLEPVLSHGAVHHVEHSTEWILVALAVSAFLIGGGLAYWMYMVNPGVPVRIRESLSGLHRAVVNKYWVDEFYDAALVKPLVVVSDRVLYRGVDVRGIDGIANGGAAAVRALAARGLKYAQTGLTQSYLFFMIVGTLAMLGWMLG